MNEHGYGKVTVGKHCDNMREVGADGTDAFGIVAIVSNYFNSTSVRVKQKMMGGLIVRESHRLITVLLYIGLMLFVHGTSLHALSCRLQSTK